MAGCSAVAGKPLLDKAAYIARVWRFLQSKAAQKCAANCSKSLVKVCKEVVLKDARPPLVNSLKDQPACLKHWCLYPSLRKGVHENFTGTNLQFHALPQQTEHHDDEAGALIRDPRGRAFMN